MCNSAKSSTYRVMMLVQASRLVYTYRCTSPCLCMRAASHISSQSRVIRHNSATRSSTAFTSWGFCCFRDSMMTDRHFSRLVNSTFDDSPSREEREGEKEGRGERKRERKRERERGILKLVIELSWMKQCNFSQPWDKECRVRWLHAVHSSQ